MLNNSSRYHWLRWFVALPIQLHFFKDNKNRNAVYLVPKVVVKVMPALFCGIYLITAKLNLLLMSSLMEGLEYAHSSRIAVGLILTDWQDTSQIM